MGAPRARPDWAARAALTALTDGARANGNLLALSIDAAALLIYRSAWTKDVKGARVSRESAMAKLFATEEAQKVIDSAVQIFGGLGVTRGNIAERLYREIRALRIYEGASEVQKIVIATRVLAAAAAN